MVPARDHIGKSSMGSCAQPFLNSSGDKPRAGAHCLTRTAIAASLLLLTIPVWAQSQAASPVYDERTPIETLAADPAAAAILNKDLPGLLTDSQYPLFKGMSLKA